MKIMKERRLEKMARPAKAIDTNSQKMSIEDKEKRKNIENKLKGNNDKLKPASYLTKRQKKIYKDILENLNKDILSNLDSHLLNQTAIIIDRMEYLEKSINKCLAEEDTNIKEITQYKSMRESYSKDFFRCCNELSLSPQARAKISISTPVETKKSLMDILNEE